MAFESKFWRNQIKRDINYLNKKMKVNVRNLNEEENDCLYSQIEIKLFTITYSLRKLMDTKKFPDNVGKKRINISKYKRNDKKQIRPFGLFDDYYFLDNKSSEFITLRYLCGQFVHAYFFQPIPDKKGNIKKLFFVSNSAKEDGIYSLSITLLLKNILKICDKYPDSIDYHFDEEKEGYAVNCK